MLITFLQLVCFTLGNFAGFLSEKMPRPAAMVVEDYPSAKEVMIPVPEKSTVPRSSFKSIHLPISVIVNNEDIHSTGRLSEEILSDSIQGKLKGLSIAGGTSSNHRYIAIKDQPSRLVADYLLNGVKYILSMENTGFVQLSTSTLISKTKLISDLPANVQKFLNERSKLNLSNVLNLVSLDAKSKQILQKKNELSFETCSVLQLTNGTKQYRVYVDYYGLTTLPLIFDEKGKLLWTANFNRLESLTTLDDLTGGASKLIDNELNHFKTLFTKTAEFANFKLADSPLNSDASKNIYGGITGYEFNLANKTESWHLAYSNDKILIDGYYSGWAH